MLIPVALPELTNGWQVAITAFQCLVVATAFKSEREAPSPYSKMAVGQEASLKVPVASQAAMFVIYTPALVYCLVRLCSLSLGGGISSPLESRASLLTSLLLSHFFKRLTEVAVVHKYSGQTDAIVAVFIGCYYAFVCFLILQMFDATMSPDILSTGMLLVGLATFVVGQAGNGFHHRLLANLRRSGGLLEDSPTSDKRYYVPTGGLFEYVATPHYLFEIIAWFGIFLVAQQVNALLVCLSMTSYLTGRAVTTMEWNQRNIPNYPKDRKSIFPGIF
jgi:very-long-chain enoyl-CoA reductase